jgi:hypothetical protein
LERQGEGHGTVMTFVKKEEKKKKKKADLIRQTEHNQLQDTLW